MVTVPELSIKILKMIMIMLVNIKILIMIMIMLVNPVARGRKITLRDRELRRETQRQKRGDTFFLRIEHLSFL